jgi:hypothetical protein
MKLGEASPVSDPSKPSKLQFLVKPVVFGWLRDDPQTPPTPKFSRFHPISTTFIFACAFLWVKILATMSGCLAASTFGISERLPWFFWWGKASNNLSKTHKVKLSRNATGSHLGISRQNIISHFSCGPIWNPQLLAIARELLSNFYDKDGVVPDFLSVTSACPAICFLSFLLPKMAIKHGLLNPPLIENYPSYKLPLIEDSPVKDQTSHLCRTQDPDLSAWARHYPVGPQIPNCGLTNGPYGCGIKNT